MTFEMKGTARLVVFIGFITAALIDLGLITFGDTQLSISAWMTYVCVKSPFIAMVLGMCLGHFAFGMNAVCEKCMGKEK